MGLNDKIKIKDEQIKSTKREDVKSFLQKTKNGQKYIPIIIIKTIFRVLFIYCVFLPSTTLQNRPFCSYWRKHCEIILYETRIQILNKMVTDESLAWSWKVWQSSLMYHPQKTNSLLFWELKSSDFFIQILLNTLIEKKNSKTCINIFTKKENWLTVQPA